MENITWKIYLLIDANGHKTAVVVNDSSDTVQVCGMQTPHGVPLHFESDAYHLPTWCAENEIQLHIVDRSATFAELWDEMPQFKQGDAVLYVPNHANGDRGHPDCQRGTVSSVTGTGAEQRVFVRYTAGETGALTPIKNLLKR